MKYVPCILWVIIFFQLSLHGCNVFDPGEVRVNSLDPKSAFFIPNKPNGIEIEVIDDEINIKWNDVSNYEEGYLVEKSINDTTNFEVIAKLAPNKNFFVDRSKTIGHSTFYKISAFIESDRQIKKRSSKVVELRINTITSLDFNYDGDEEVSLNWTLNSHFADGIILERKISQNSEFEKISEIDSDSRSFSDIISDLKTFEIIYKVSSFQHKSDSLLVNDSSIIKIDVHFPMMQSIIFNSENETVIEWNSKSSFETGFILEKASRMGHFGDFGDFNKIADIQPNQTVYTDTSSLKSNFYYRYRVSAKLNDSLSKQSTIQSGIFYMPKPELIASGTANKSIELYWNNPSENVREFIIERSSDGNEYSVLSRVDHHTSLFEDKTVDVNKLYSYRIRTLSSGYSNEQYLSFNSGYKMDSKKKIIQYDNSFSDPKSPTIQVLQKSNKIGVYSHHIDNQYRFYPPVFILDQNTLSVETEFSTDFPYLSSHFSSDGQKYLSLGGGGYYLQIHDLSSGDLLLEIPNAHQNKTSQISEGKAYFNFDETLIASFVNRDEGLRIWDTETGSLAQELNYELFQIKNIKFHPTKNTLAVKHIMGLDLWDLSEERIIKSIPESSNYGISALTFSDSGDVLYYASNKKISIIDSVNGTILDSFLTDETAHQLSFNKEKNHLAVGFKNRHYNYYIQIVDLAYLNTVQLIQIDTLEYPSFVFDQSGEKAFSIKKVDRKSAELREWVNEDNWYSIK